jgi:hypothetical protein
MVWRNLVQIQRVVNAERRRDVRAKSSSAAIESALTMTR